MDSTIRVVLHAGPAVTARVAVADRWHEAVPIVTLRLQEDAATALRSVSGDVVVLEEKATSARVRVGGRWHEGVPIFQERPIQGGAFEHVRVRVQAVREK